MTPIRTRYALFGAIGLALLLAAALVKDHSPQWREFLFNVGIVTLSVSILDGLWYLAGGNPLENQVTSLSEQVERLSRSVDVIERAKKVGLVELHDCAAITAAKRNGSSYCRALPVPWI